MSNTMTHTLPPVRRIRRACLIEKSGTGIERLVEKGGTGIDREMRP
ncbi:MAG: hypothetical protein P8Y54_10430 [Xanthomonadales bacterium]